MPEKILIVEDEEEMSRILSIILERSGYDVRVSSDGSRLFPEDGPLPDLILLDKHLQGKNGLDICKMIKSSPRTKDITVIIISASPKINEEIADACADDFIEKPFDVSALLRLIGSYLKVKAKS